MHLCKHAAGDWQVLIKHKCFNSWWKIVHSNYSKSHGYSHVWAKCQRHKSLRKLEARAWRAPRIMVKFYFIPWPCQICDESPCLLHFEESLGVFGLIYLRNFQNAQSSFLSSFSTLIMSAWCFSKLFCGFAILVLYFFTTKKTMTKNTLKERS